MKARYSSAAWNIETNIWQRPGGAEEGNSILCTGPGHSMEGTACFKVEGGDAKEAARRIGIERESLALEKPTTWQGGVSQRGNRIYRGEIFPRRVKKNQP